MRSPRIEAIFLWKLRAKKILIWKAQMAVKFTNGTRYLLKPKGGGVVLRLEINRGWLGRLVHLSNGGGW